MSSYFSWQQAIIKSKLESTTRHVCLTIGCHMAADGSGCFPSYQTIADETGLSTRSVIQHVAKAAAAGYLEKEGRMRDNGSASSNVYRPTMPKVANTQDVVGGSEPRSVPHAPRSVGGSASNSVGGSEPRSPHINRPLSLTSQGLTDQGKAGSTTGGRSGFEKSIGKVLRVGPKQHSPSTAMNGDTLTEALGKMGLQTIPGDWVKNAMVMRKWRSDQANTAARKFEFYYTRGAGKEVRGEDMAMWAQRWSVWIKDERAAA